MQVTRGKDQWFQTLDEFYEALARYDGFERISRLMLSLVARLRELPDSRRVYALTSHSDLCLLPKDDYRCSFKVVIAIGPEGYVIRHPAEDDWAEEVATSENDAVEKILLAMSQSDEWSRVK